MFDVIFPISHQTFHATPNTKTTGLRTHRPVTVQVFDGPREAVGKGAEEEKLSLGISS